ncbi:hypothetical protein K7I13_08655 [Brucepastera parasyntrophica]|uniref:hypothetical protein n=1 Tax=Brucepastera parasyntrophica TaxID=2880008 RepID=UPI00210B0C99|nr:hypothetical protein [Brucepastera parasyntrophica]ULQ58632.1 hypothetical protein K7I13_08655 [Brucepastera parasyntrophica]
MKKVFILSLFYGCIVLQIFAGGQAESGRDSNMDIIESGQFIDPSKIDAYSYINDYTFPYDINGNEDLSIFTKLEKKGFLQLGINLIYLSDFMLITRISLKETREIIYSLYIIPKYY